MKLVPIMEIKQDFTAYGLPERSGMSAKIKSPILHVRHWFDLGAKNVFIKDYDGMVYGKPQFSKKLEYLDNTTQEKIYYCGGIRDLRSVRIFENRKYSKIVSATAVIENKKFLRNIVANDIGPIALWIDSVDGFVYTRNAQHPVGKRTIDLLRSLPEYGIDEIFFCNRSEEGPLHRPDFDMIENLLDLELPNLYVADNINSHEDLRRLAQYEGQGLAGVAIKDALYNGTFKMAELKEMFRTEKVDI